MEIERKKLELSRSINNWDLDSQIPQAITMEMSEDPFNELSQAIPVRFSASEFKEIFFSKVWPKYLKPTVASALKHASKELGHAHIHVALMSGGSSNLRWLEGLLRRDFDDKLKSSEIVSLHESYQEVVTKGLAIECARRGYEAKSEFVNVTYNPLFLVLDPDGRGEERKKFKLVSDPQKIGQPEAHAQLLSSAATLDSAEDISLRWKVTLDHPPKHSLRYYFLKNPADIDDLESRYNIIQSEIPTTRGTNFNSHLKVDLHLRPDGTCTPTFIYRTGKNDEPVYSEVGAPFFLDKVTAGASLQKSAFVGIDFGTSTSAVSYVDWAHVELIQRRQSESEWLQIHELLDLPFPVSAPLKRFIAGVGTGSILTGLDALESLLAFTDIIFWAAESSVRKNRKIRVFGGGYKRSAGQLKAVLFNLMQSGASSEIGRRLRERIKRIPEGDVSSAVNQLDKEKHQKQVIGTFKPNKILEQLGNILKYGLDDFKFGYFENVQQVGFGGKHKGIFRVAHGSMPFHEKIIYEGPFSFSEQEAFIVSPSTGLAISMTPMMYWEHSDGMVNYACQCFLYDGVSREKQYEFKQCDAQATMVLKGKNDLIEYLEGLKDGTTSAKRYEGLKFISEETE